MSAAEVSANGRGEVAAMRRLLNDSIAGVAERFDDEGEEIFFDFQCECEDLSCTRVVGFTVVQYRCARFWPVVVHSSVAA